MNKFVVLLLLGFVVGNMCCPPTEKDEAACRAARRNRFVTSAKNAGLPDEQIELSVNALEQLLDNTTSVSIVPFLDGNCATLNTDGKLLEIDEKNRDKFKYSDVAGQNITSRLRFWSEYMNLDDGVNLFIALKNICVEFMSPVERKKIEDMAKEAGIHEDDIPHIVDLQMKIYFDVDMSKSHINYVLKANYKKLGKNQYTLDVPSAEKELEKLKSENLSENDSADSAYFWAHKYLETTGVDQLKSLKNLCVVLMRMQPYLTARTNIFDQRIDYTA